MPFILPDSKITLPDFPKEEGETYQIAINYATLSEADKKAMLEHLATAPLVNIDSRLKPLLHVDLSECHLADCKFNQIIDLKNRLSQYFLSFKLLPNIDPKTFDPTNRAQRDVLNTEAGLNKKPRDELASALLDHALSHGDELIIFTDFIRYSHFYNANIDSAQFLKPWQPYFSKMSSDVFSVDEWTTLLQDLTKVVKAQLPSLIEVLYGPKRIFDMLETEVRKPNLTSEHIYHKAAWLTWCAIMLHKAISDKTLTSLNSSQKISIANVLCDLYHFSDESLQLSSGRLFFSVLNQAPESLLACLKDIKTRLHPIALALAAIYGAQDKTAAEFLAINLYKEGAYNRAAVKVLTLLARNKVISDKHKKTIASHCCQRLLKNDKKDEHYEVWTMLTTLLSYSDEAESIVVENFLEAQANLADFSLEKMYWAIFQKALGVSESTYEQYKANFNFPNHHLLFGMRQNNDGPRPRLGMDTLLKTLLSKGRKGYLSLRYDSPNPHLEAVLQTENGAFVKAEWRKTQPESFIIKQGRFKGHRVLITDDVKEIISWGMGINCLDPLRGECYIVPHLIDGQNQIILLKNEKNRVVAGCVLHLMLSHLEHPSPVLALGNVYIREDHHSDIKEKMEIQSIVDKIALRKAKRLSVSCIALKVGDGPYELDRPLPINTSDCAVFMKKGYAQLPYRDGLDMDLLAHNRRERTEAYETRIYQYQIMYAPLFTPFYYQQAYEQAKHSKKVNGMRGLLFYYLHQEIEKNQRIAQQPSASTTVSPRTDMVST